MPYRGVGTVASSESSTASAVTSLEFGLVPQPDPVAQGRAGHRLDVVGRDVAAPAEPRERLGRAEQAGRAAGRGAQLQRRRDRVDRHRSTMYASTTSATCTCSTARRAAARSAAGGHRAYSPAAREVARVEAVVVGAQYAQLLVAVRQRDGELEQEPVELRLGQRVGALVLDRVLGGGDQERVRQRAGPRPRPRPGAPP